LVFSKIFFKNEMIIPFNRPVLPKSFDEIITKTISDGWLTTGPVVNSFETKLKEYLKSEHVVAVNSCTAALHLAIAAFKYNPGDRFIAPTYTFVATVEAGEYLGMNPVLVDSDDNYNIDLNQTEDILKKDKKIKCVIPVHFGGFPVDMHALNFLGKKYGVNIIEDAAHALESISSSGKVGITSDAACFSFYANKNITTAGEGGAVSTNNSEYADRIRKLSLHGMSKDGWKRFARGGKWGYDISELGYKYNLTDLAASFGIWQLDQVKNWSKRRTYIVKSYLRSFKKIPGLVTSIDIPNNLNHANHLFIVRIDAKYWGISRDQVIQELNKRGIGTSVHYIPIHMHSYYVKKYKFKSNDFPVAKSLYEKVVSLPLYPSLKNEELKYIIGTFLDIWNKNKKN
jgi:dTDP-4-amino-4,6-dideoxygalactose transaminase